MSTLHRYGRKRNYVSSSPFVAGLQEVQAESSRRFLSKSMESLRRDIKSLRNGTEGFSTITREQRSQFLSEILTELSDDNLIALVKSVNAETHRRCVEIDMPAAARRAVEESVIDPYDQQVDERFDAMFCEMAH